MRVLLDANIFISYLLNPKSKTFGEIVTAAIRGNYTLLLPEALMDEFVNKIPEKPYLAERIMQGELKTFVEILAGVSESIPVIKDVIPTVTRDPKDDYLLAYAMVGEADYLVTGDEDLLVLGKVSQVKIIKPRDFVEVIRDL